MTALEAAIAKRARKAAKREQDAERTRDGRAYVWVGDSWRGWETPRGHWDRVEMYWRGHYDGWDHRPRWRQRLEHRRSLPMLTGSVRTKTRPPCPRCKGTGIEFWYNEPDWCCECGGGGLV